MQVRDLLQFRGRLSLIICHAAASFALQKYLLGDTQTLELHPMDAGLASPNEKVYGSNTLSAIGKQLFPVKKKIAMIKDEHCRKM